MYAMNSTVQYSTYVPIDEPTANSGAPGSLAVMWVITSVRSLMSAATYVRGVYTDTHTITVTHTT